ncbi:cytochrome-c peroxidase, partial [Bradyrhizobium sp. UFLA05-112]
MRGNKRSSAHRSPWIAMTCILILGGLLVSPAAQQALVQPPEANSTFFDEPITPVPRLPQTDPLKVRLGERLFSDPRLSRDNSRSCSSCHDLGTNGASRSSYDAGLDGSSLPLNTPTVFNAVLSFRFGWEGKIRNIESDIKSSLENPQVMGANISDVAERLGMDPGLRREFTTAYGSEPDAANVVDALASFQRTLITPGSRFDRWLTGEAEA